MQNADRNWHPIARRLWDTLKSSWQADFYLASDWALAYSLCEGFSYYKALGKRSGQMLQTIYSAFERLLVAEGGSSCTSPSPRSSRRPPSPSLTTSMI
ncbi:hypothetical protein ACIQRW_27320 [Streptomyces sp. NPDC091287]|uniref:phage terminase small subunit n=1 Tax=Streptomyces sp. NPDC091287 TaxID=3365988 RepID=UPI00382B6BC9